MMISYKVLASFPGPSSERKGRVHTACACAKITALFLVKSFGYFQLPRGQYILTTYNDRYSSVFLFTYPTVCGQARYVAFLEDSRFRALHSF